MSALGRVGREAQVQPLRCGMLDCPIGGPGIVECAGARLSALNNMCALRRVHVVISAAQVLVCDFPRPKSPEARTQMGPRRDMPNDSVV